MSLDPLLVLDDPFSNSPQNMPKIYVMDFQQKIPSL